MFNFYACILFFIRCDLAKKNKILFVIFSNIFSLSNRVRYVN